MATFKAVSRLHVDLLDTDGVGSVEEHAAHAADGLLVGPRPVHARGPVHRGAVYAAVSRPRHSEGKNEIIISRFYVIFFNFVH